MFDAVIDYIQAEGGTQTFWRGGASPRGAPQRGDVRTASRPGQTTQQQRAREQARHMKRGWRDSDDHARPLAPLLAAALLLSYCAGLGAYHAAWLHGARAAEAALAQPAAAARMGAEQSAAAGSGAAGTAADCVSLQVLLETRVCGSPAVDGCGVAAAVAMPNALRN